MASGAIHFLTIPPSRESAEQHLLPGLRAWFAATIGEPTLAQRFAWNTISSGQSLLLSSPTGTGKTLAAFLPIISQLGTQQSDGLQCLYVAPLKALCRDAYVNLKRAWRSIEQGGYGTGDLRVGLRTGDTSQRVRRRHLSNPPAILVTTPESLAQMLAHPPSHAFLRNVRVAIIDEIHALVGSKRGADLAVCLERLDDERSEPIQRIGLSATCTPLHAVAKYLVGTERACAVAQVADLSEKQFTIEPLFENLEYSPGWLAALLDRLDDALATCRTSIIFTNTRNLAERLTWALRRRYPQRCDEIAIHHSAIVAARRRAVERRLKQGRIWTVVSSTSLELGIDIGTVDRVIFVHPPGGVVRLLQRVGRAGHRPGEPRRGLLLTASPSELLEAVVTASSGRDGQIEAVRVIDQPLDVLCQQLVGMAMTGLWSERAAFDLIRRAAPYRALSWDDFQDCLDYLSGQHRDGTAWLPARLAREGDCFTIADARTARLLRRNLGTILTEDACRIALRAPTDEDAANSKPIGEVDLAYAERLQTGDRFVLDGRCLELKRREFETLIVDEVFGRPQVPRWLGNGVPMPNELARRIFLFRVQAADMLRDGEAALIAWLRLEYHLGESASASLVRLLQQQEMISEIPTLPSLLIETVSMQSCREYFVHTPMPRSANETIARVLMARWKLTRSGEIAAIAADLGIYLLMPTAVALELDAWRDLLSERRFAADFREHLSRSELLQQTFARIAQTGLMVLRNPLGRKRKVGGKDWTERRLFDQIRERVGDFVLLRQAEREAIQGACDLESACAFVERITSMPIRVRHLAKPSPFGETLLQAGMGSSPITAAAPASYERVG
jgi:ATP-dependent helicase Lhr and Lhr-like helicase